MTSCVYVCISEMGERGTMLKANRERGRGEIAYVLRVSASVLSSLKPFNKERRGGKEVWGGMKEGAFGRIQISPPPPKKKLFSVPRLLSPFLFLHTLTPSLHSSFIYPFPPSKPKHSLPCLMCACACVCVCWMHISLTG